MTEDVVDLSSTKELDEIYELVYSQGTVKAFLLTGDHRDEVILDPDDCSGALLGLLGLNPKRPYLKVPLSVGQKWGKKKGTFGIYRPNPLFRLTQNTPG